MVVSHAVESHSIHHVLEVVEEYHPIRHTDTDHMVMTTDHIEVTDNK